jgi:hypothetical protein
MPSFVTAITVGKRHFHRRSGFTVSELAIVLGVVGLVLAGIWVAAGNVYFQLKYNRFSTDILLLAQKVKTLYGKQRVASGVAQFDIENQLGLFPNGFVATAVSGKLVTMQGYVSTWDQFHNTSSNIWVYEIDLADLEPQASGRLLMDLSSMDNIYELYTGTANWGGTDESPPTILPPMTVAKATAACPTSGVWKGYLEIYISAI